MKFEIKCKGDTTVDNIDKELMIFEEEAEDEWEKQTEIAKQKMKGKLSMLPVPINLEFPPLVLSHVKQDDKTIFMFTSVGGDSKTKLGKLQKLIFRGANKKTVKNLTAFLNSRGLDVDVSISND